tara:strand:+ start:61 stop:219 length:159 start_codon:yes stop_codon:yes gene_type:complete
LKIISNEDTEIKIKLKGTLLNPSLIKEVSNGKYLYRGYKKIAIMNGMIGQLK